MRKIVLKVKPGSKNTTVLENEDGSFSVAVKERPTGGRANVAAIDALSEYFNVSSSRIRITHGHRNKNKLAEIG